MSSLDGVRTRDVLAGVGVGREILHEGLPERGAPDFIAGTLKVHRKVKEGIGFPFSFFDDVEMDGFYRLERHG